MTMYRMRQREFIAALAAAALDLRDGADRSRRPPYATRSSARTPTRSRRSRRRSRITCWRSSSSSSATPRACAAAYDVDQPQSARRLRDHRHRLSDRSRPHQRAARLQRPDRQHLRQHRDGRLPARERVGHERPARRPRPRHPGLPAVVHDGVRLPAARRRLRAVSSIMPQKRNPVALEHARAIGSKAVGQAQAIIDRRPQHAVRRHRRHRGRPAAAGRVDVPRRDAHGDAGGGDDARRRLRRRRGWPRAPATAARR